MTPSLLLWHRTRRHVVNTIKLCGFSKSNEGLKVVSQPDSRDIHLPWSSPHYRSTQVCLSYQHVFIVQTVWVILLGPISWCTFKNTDRSRSRWRDSGESLSLSCGQTQCLQLLQQGGGVLVFSSTIKNVLQTKHESHLNCVIIVLHNLCLKAKVSVSCNIAAITWIIRQHEQEDWYGFKNFLYSDNSSAQRKAVKVLNKIIVEFISLKKSTSLLLPFCPLNFIDHPSLLCRDTV